MNASLPAGAIPMWALLAVLALAPPGAADERPPLLDELVNNAGFPASEVSQIGNKVLIREFDVPEPHRRVAFVALVRIKTDGSRLADELSPLALATGAQGAKASGGFSDPVAADDLARLQFSDAEMEALADCHVEHCKFKLGRQGIEEVRAIDWTSPDAGDVFTKLFREEAQAYVEKYRQQGNGALILYADKSKPLPLSSAVESIAGQFPAFRRHAPAFSAYLLSYPKGRRPSMTEAIMWSIGDFGYRPTLAIDHLFVDRDPEPEGATALVAVKTIYANHYLAGRIQMGALLDGAVAFGIPGHFILLVDRIEFDDSLNGFKRSLLSRGLRADVEGRMKRLRSLADEAR